jgi:DNA-binding NtrC family response regulator
VVHTTGDGLHALRMALDDEVDLIIAESKLPGMTGIELLAELRKLRPRTAVILQTAFGSVEDAVHAMREGAADFLSKPYADDQIQLAVDRSLERLDLVMENEKLREALDDRVRLDNLVAYDVSMHDIFKTVKAVADTRTTVLLTGESGTGKTLLARAIHRLSSRAQGPFVEVNCGALPETLLEAELFGHVRGAFTGAVRDRAGKFESATGGTIFLDEIGTSSPGFQVKLLRVLQDRVLERLGATETIPVDVRVLLATNRDLAEAVQQGQFREDLYYRINVVTVEMPPLRARPDDIPHLAEHFLRRFALEIGKAITGFTAEAMDTLIRARFPGNVRQLENVVERAVVLSEGQQITVADLPPDLTQLPGQTETGLVAGETHLLPLKEALEIPEKIIIERALRAHDGNRQQTASSLAINRSTLFNKMRKFGLL